MSTDQLCDYTNAGFTLHLVCDDVKVYASVNQEMYGEEDGLALTGNYIVYLLHPTQGSVTFTLEKDLALDRWITRDAKSWVDNDIIIKIAEQIDVRDATRFAAV